MSYNDKLLVNDNDGSNFYNDKLAKEEASPIISSDKEVHPDDLSTDHGEGHGHGKGAKKASVFGSAMNIANTIMGAGILALPNVISQFGILLGASIIAVSCFLTYISCVLLLKSKNLSRHSKYITIGKHCFGAGGLWAVKVIIIVNNVGLCIAYLIIFSSVGQNLFGGFVEECNSTYSSNPFYCRPWFLSLIASVLVTPFVYARSMAKLQGASAVAVAAAAIFSIITIEHFITVEVDGTAAPGINFLPSIGNVTSALASITSVFLAFTFQFNFFPVYKTLQNPTDGRMKQTTLLGLAIVLTIYLSVAICGYLTFGKDTENLLNNFTKDKLGIATFIIINVAFLISSTLTLPLMFFGAKNEIYGAIKLLRKKWYKSRVMPEGEDEEEEDEKAIEKKYGFNPFQFNIYITVLFALIVALSIFVPGINTVFSFVGSTAANGLNFLLPSMFYLRLASKMGKLRPLAMFMLGLGVVMGVVGIVSSALAPSS